MKPPKIWEIQICPSVGHISRRSKNILIFFCSFEFSPVNLQLVVKEGGLAIFEYISHGFRRNAFSDGIANVFQITVCSGFFTQFITIDLNNLMKTDFAGIHLELIFIIAHWTKTKNPKVAKCDFSQSQLFQAN